MKIAIAQNNYTAGDTEGNKALIGKSIAAARHAGAATLVLARHALAGSPLYNLKPHAEMPAAEGLRVVAESEEGDVIIVAAADRFEHGAVENRIKHYAAVAKKAGKPLVYANHLGGQGDVVYDGSSFVLDAEGRLITLLKSFDEDFATVETDGPGTQSLPVRDKTAATYDAIIFGLRDYFRKNGFTRACLGMSGGIDSAVVLALVAEVLPPENIEVLMLPSQFSSGHSVTDSREMIARLGVQSELITIAPAYECVKESLAPIFAGTSFGTAEENLQSRLRGVMLMALSNKRGHILLNTSNKSEAAVGYGTLYGDMAGSLAPIADLYKTEVYALARYINRGREVIPPNIIDKAPSAELRPDQKDSDSLPPYDVLDEILFQLVEQGRTPEELRGFDAATVERVWKLLVRAEFKRRQAPPAIQLSSQPFGNGFRLPLITV
jgi:NAD+ synthase (glutamine-hydrolysing)